MSDSISENNKRIAKNTFLLYIRMGIMTLISLYTSRITLEALGLDNMGIYNVVGGIVGLMGILNGAMVVSTQRFLSFELGKGFENLQRLTTIFSTSFRIYCYLGLLVLILAESIGLWFLNNKLDIPKECLTAANVVYQFSILGSVVALISNPFSAAIVSHEKIGIYAYFAIINAILSLVLVFILKAIKHENVLIIYGVFMFIIQLINILFNWIYCLKKFPECKINSRTDKLAMRELSSYSGWSLFGSISGVLRTQGITVVINMFYSPAVIAALALASQISSKVQMFFSNFMTSINPQIIKYYSQKDYENMINLVIRASKFSYFLIFLLGLPVFLETDFLVKLWLGNIPKYVTSFTRILILISAVDAMTHSIMTAVHATGHIKLYQSVVGGIMLLNVPISYFCLRFGMSPISVYLVALIISIICTFIRLYILNRQMPFPILQYLTKAYLIPIKTSIVAIIFPLLLMKILPNYWCYNVFICIMSIISTIISIWIFGVSKHEKNRIKQFALSKFKAK